jgi:hypothetical protein
MGYKPADFFLGIVDFFAIWLPGVLLSFLFLDIARVSIFGPILPAIGSKAEGWVAFIFASYLLGQFAALLGATFMDGIYDKTYLRFKRRNGDKCFEMAKKLQGSHYEIVGALKWSEAFVRLRNSEAALEVGRFQAVSKFFRSLVVVLLIYAGKFLLTSQWPAFTTCIVLLLFSFWRFANQRWKFAESTYLYFIELSVSHGQVREDAKD